MSWNLFDHQPGSPPKFSYGTPHFEKWVSFSPNGRWLACGSVRARVWDLHVPAYERKARVIGNNGREVIIDFSPCGRYLVTATRAATAASPEIKIYDATKLGTNNDDLVLRRIEIEAGVGRFDFRHDGDQVALADIDGNITIISTQPSAAVADTRVSWSASKHSLTDVAYSPDGIHVASSGLDETIRVWEVETQKLVYSIVDSAVVYSVDFHPDGKRLVSGNHEGAIHVWDVSFLGSQDRQLKDTK